MHTRPEGVRDARASAVWAWELRGSALRAELQGKPRSETAGKQEVQEVQGVPGLKKQGKGG